MNQVDAMRDINRLCYILNGLAGAPQQPYTDVGIDGQPVPNEGHYMGVMRGFTHEANGTVQYRLEQMLHDGAVEGITEWQGLERTISDITYRIYQDSVAVQLGVPTDE